MLAVRIGALLLAVCGLVARADAAPQKVLRVAMSAAERSFDPQVESDLYSNWVNQVIFDPLYRYDYLARPVKVVPNTAEAMPEVTEGGLVYTVRLKSGIRFTPHAAFQGKPRALSVSDYEYSLKRLVDPKNRSQWQWLVEGKIVGLDELAAQAKKTGKFDYDAKIEGIRQLSPNTLQIRLKRPDYNFIYILAMTATGAVAREVVDAHAADIGAHPVGTGPFVLKLHTRRSKMVLEKNPDFRDEFIEVQYADSNDPQDREVVKYLAGRKVPMIDRVEIDAIEEPQPRFLAFLNGEHDVLENSPREFINQIMPGGKLAPKLEREGVKAQREPQMEVVFTYFNMEDPVVGGYTPERTALRRAIVLAYNMDAEINVARKGQAIQAQSMIPPGVTGYDPSFKSDAGEHNIAKAKALLDIYGYVDRDGDGWREDPQGNPIRMVYTTQPGQDYRDLDLLWYKANTAIGLNVEIRKVQFADAYQAAKLKKLQIWGLSWGADYPDAENFVQLLYGPNCAESNKSCFNLPEYNQLYDRAASLPPSEERNQIYREMARLALAYAPWKLGVHRIWHHFARPWVIGFKHHPINATNFFVYSDIDVDAQAKGRAR
ncbi:MAG: bicyclomycin resistance protein [Betaproteobacteria bacterium]|nr:bicyclomycin resistance protein [Betaproteobacteria bacterium]